MKIYINSDWDVLKFYKISNYFVESNWNIEDYVKLPTLSSKKIVERLLDCLSFSELLYIYDYSSMELTISEFRKFYEIIKNKKIKILFLMEDDAFLDNLVEISKVEYNIHSLRTKKKVSSMKQSGIASGRPQLSENMQKKIYKDYYEKKYSMRQVAVKNNVSLGTVSKYAKIYKDKNKIR